MVESKAGVFKVEFEIRFEGRRIGDLNLNLDSKVGAFEMKFELDIRIDVKHV